MFRLPISRNIIINNDRQEGDPYWDNVAALLYFNQGHDAVATVDEKGNSWTFSGNAKINRNQSPYRRGFGCIELDGTGDLISTADATKFRITNKDFTIECLCCIRSTKINTVSNKRDASSAEEHTFQITSGNGVTFAGYTSGSPFLQMTSASSIINLNQWYLLAATRIGGNSYLFVDGQLVASDSFSAGSSASTNTSSLKIGRDGFDTARDLNGFIAMYRFTENVGRYSASYVPSLPFPNRGI